MIIEKGEFLATDLSARGLLAIERGSKLKPRVAASIDDVTSRIACNTAFLNGDQAQRYVHIS